MPELPPIENTPRTEPVPIGDAVSFQAKSAEPPKSNRWSGIRTFFVWLLRWALLGAGVGGVWFLGVLIAQFLPASSPRPPLQEVVMRRTSRTVQKVRRLPAWWRGDSLRPSAAREVPRLPAESIAPTPTTRPVALSEIQREQITVELEAIQDDLQRLRDRTSAVETQLGLPDLDRPLEERVGSVENRLAPPTEGRQAPAAIAPAPNSTAPTTAGIEADPLFQIDAYRVTLPSDILFEPGDSILQPDSQVLLDSILQDIGQYPGATILIGCYSDIQSGDGTPTDLSYQQAIAIQRHLTQRLGSDAYHWIAVGYGDTALGPVGGMQLGRRVTIAIVP
ncbi:MAG: OmpA family protein [Leptolyngbyaceae cyanobacterium]